MRDQIGHPRPDEAVAIGYRTVSAAAREFAVLDGPPLSDDWADDCADDCAEGSDTRSSGVDRETLQAELSLMFLSYLGAAPPSGGESQEGVDFFEIWS